MGCHLWGRTELTSAPQLLAFSPGKEQAAGVLGYLWGFHGGSDGKGICIDGSPLGFSVPGILQTRTLEWVAISFSNPVLEVRSPKWVERAAFLLGALGRTPFLAFSLA